MINYEDFALDDLKGLNEFVKNIKIINIDTVTVTQTITTGSRGEYRESIESYEYFRVWFHE